MSKGESLPIGWERSCLGEVVEVCDRLRVPLNSQERSGRSGPYPYYGANGQVDSIDDFIFDGEYTLLAEDGGYFDDSTRNVAYKVSGKFWVNNHAHVLLPVNGMTTAFLTPLLNSIDWMPYVSGTTRLKLTQAKMRDVPVSIPPLEEQRRIVAKIEALQQRTRRARTALNAIPPLLEKFRQSVLASAFRGDLTADWRAQNPDVESASVLLERIREERRRRWEEAELAKMKAKGKVPSDDRWKEKYKEAARLDSSKLPKVPDSWIWERLDALSAIKGGLSKGKRRNANSVLRKVPYLRVANVQRGFLDLDDVRLIDATELEISQLALLPGDVLFNEGGDRDKLGRGWVWEGQIGECIHQNHVFRARLLTRQVLSRLISYFGNSHGQKYFIDEGKQTTNLASLSLSKLSALPVPVMPTAEAEILLKRLESRLSAIDRLELQLDSVLPRLSQLDQSVLAKAFRGELVPQDPNDEPASKLLERIRAAKPEKPTRRGRRRARPPKPSPPPPPEPEPNQLSLSLKPSPAPEPASRPLDLDDGDLRDRIHPILLGRGPLERDTAIREIASALRDDGTVEFRRLRRGGPLYRTIDAALDAGLASGLFDEPAAGEVRAVLRGARDYTLENWRHVLLACLGEDAAEREDAIEAAATWASENMGLEFQRLRKDGVIVKGLKSAIRSALRRGEIEKVGTRRIRRT